MSCVPRSLPFHKEICSCHTIYNSESDIYFVSTLLSPCAVPNDSNTLMHFRLPSHVAFAAEIAGSCGRQQSEPVISTRGNTGGHGESKPCEKAPEKVITRLQRRVHACISLLAACHPLLKTEYGQPSITGMATSTPTVVQEASTSLPSGIRPGIDVSEGAVKHSAPKQEVLAEEFMFDLSALLIETKGDAFVSQTTPKLQSPDLYSAPASVAILP